MEKSSKLLLRFIGAFFIIGSSMQFTKSITLMMLIISILLFIFGSGLFFYTYKKEKDKI